MTPEQLTLLQDARLTPRVRFAVLQRDGFTCRYCGRRPPEVRLHVDHIVPRSKGGSHDPGNLITSCRTCNQGKAARLMVGIEAEVVEPEDAVRDLSEGLAILVGAAVDVLEHAPLSAERGRSLEIATYAALYTILDAGDLPGDHHLVPLLERFRDGGDLW